MKVVHAVVDVEWDAGDQAASAAAVVPEVLEAVTVEVWVVAVLVEEPQEAWVVEVQEDSAVVARLVVVWGVPQDKKDHQVSLVGLHKDKVDQVLKDRDLTMDKDRMDSVKGE